MQLIAHDKEVNDVILCNVCMPEGMTQVRLAPPNVTAISN